MRLNKRKARLQPTQAGHTAEATLSHGDLVDRGRALGLPAFIGAWPTETLAAKVRELEAGHDPA